MKFGILILNLFIVALFIVHYNRAIPLVANAMTLLLFVVIIFAAALLQSLSGFAFALITMPLVALVLGIRTATPLVAVAALTVQGINMIRYRSQVNMPEMIRLALAAVVGVPFGVWALINVSESIIRSILGIVMIVYALYTLARPESPYLRSMNWSYVAGFVAGCLGGAYNTSGPPVVVYGSLRQWHKDEFRATLQTFFFFTSVVTLISHFLASNITSTVVEFYLYAIPAMLLGLYLGSKLDRFVDKDRFRLLVVGLILLLGVSLLIK